MTYIATYSPEDNKLRLYSSTRLDRELYARVRGAGFIYAPKQELFVAPMWTPDREDLLIELCGEIDDEDTSLVERAEERADRFVDYKDKRISDAECAQEAVHASLTTSRWVNLFLSAATANATPARTPSGSRTGCVRPSRCGTRRSIGKTAPKAHSDTPSTKSFPVCGIAAAIHKQNQRLTPLVGATLGSREGTFVLPRRSSGLSGTPNSSQTLRHIAIKATAGWTAKILRKSSPQMS